MGSGAVITGELAKCFDEKFSVANAIARTGLSAGLIAMPLLIQFCIDSASYRWNKPSLYSVWSVA